MTKSQWQNSAEFYKLQFLNNLAAQIKDAAGQFETMLAIVHAENPGITCSDKFNLCAMESRIVRLETDKLWNHVIKLVDSLSLHRFDDVCRCNNPWKDGKCPIGDGKCYVGQGQEQPKEGEYIPYYGHFNT